MTVRERIPDDFEVRPVNPSSLESDVVRAVTAGHIATCGTCGLSWDNSIVTGMTPAPSARCPFEAFHRDADPLTEGVLQNRERSLAAAWARKLARWLELEGCDLVTGDPSEDARGCWIVGATPAEPWGLHLTFAVRAELNLVEGEDE